MASQNDATIYYDGACNLCSGIVDRLKSSARGTQFVTRRIQEQLPPGISSRAAMRDVHLVDSDGRLYSGANAVLKALSLYARLPFIFSIGRLPLVRTLIRIIYRLIADSRYRVFGRR